MNRNVIRLLGGVFALLIVGLFFRAVGVHPPYIQQVSDAEGSTIALTDNKVWMLIALVAIVLANLGGMAVSLYGVMWFLNREVNRVSQQPAQPFKLLSSGSATEVAATGNPLADNALMVVIGLGVLMIVATLLVLVVT